jgi:hypothetical protein
MNNDVCELQQGRRPAMSKELLEQFFKENSKKSEIPSAAAMTHFSILMERNDELRGAFKKISDDFIFSREPKRKIEVMMVQESIESATTLEDIVKLMRRGVDTMCQSLLIRRALEFEDELVPDVVRRLKTSLNTYFIESAARILSLCSIDIADEIFEYYDDMRSPYAQSMALIVLGFKADETYIPWLIEKHYELKRLYPDEDYHDGAYYAIYEIERRFNLYDGD